MRGLALAALASITAILATSGCGSGRCTEGAACIPDNPCHLGSQSCSGGTTCTDLDQFQPNGTTCGSNGTCVAGSCVDGGAGGCVAPAACGPSAASTCLITDENNCGACGNVCLTGECRKGQCAGCRPDFAQDCRADQFCVDGTCASLCAFGLDSGTERSCGAESLCRPFETTDPPRYNVGLCTPTGDPSLPGLGEPCDGGCQGSLECVPGVVPSIAGSACSSVCDPLVPSSCPSSWGCHALADGLQFYLGFGYCHEISAGELAVGQACGGLDPCRAGTTCALGGLPDGGRGCAQLCDPMAADGGCGPDGCAPFITNADDYSGIGGCMEVSFGSQGLNDSCNFQSCALPYTCDPLPAGGDDCMAICNPWHPSCPVSTGCLPFFGAHSNDYQGWGVCYPLVQNSQPEFGQCSATVNNCDANLYCLAQSGDLGTCIQFCDPFDPSTCPDQQWCNALSDPQGTYAGAGICNGLTGNKHAGDSCQYGDCLTNDCYYLTPRDPAGICIQACPIGSQTACPGGQCLDEGFGNGLGACALADGGRWD